jgi:hypothetical protein
LLYFCRVHTFRLTDFDQGIDQAIALILHHTAVVDYRGDEAKDLSAKASLQELGIGFKQID